MSVLYCHGCDRQYDEDFTLECPGCGESADAAKPSALRGRKGPRLRSGMPSMTELGEEKVTSSRDSASTSEPLTVPDTPANAARLRPLAMAAGFRVLAELDETGHTKDDACPKCSGLCAFPLPAVERAQP